MLMEIEKVLTKEQVAAMRDELDAANWVDGRVTTGYQAWDLKRNEQMPEEHPLTRKLRDVVLLGLAQSQQFISAALPLRVYPPMFNRYAGGGRFGMHVDTAIRQDPLTAGRIRTDLSATLFLSEPDEYEGGELIVEDTYGTHSAKLEAGNMVLYPATSLHRVEPVTRGARVSSFFWIQSMIRDDGQRTMLFDLDTAIQQLAPVQDEIVKESAIQITGVYHNLLRQWAEM